MNKEAAELCKRIQAEETEEIEHIEVYDLIQERNKNDDWKRYSLSEVQDILQRKKQRNK